MRDITLDDHIFAWFNERQPDQMQRCLNAYDELNRDSDRYREADETGTGSVPEGDRARAEGIAKPPSASPSDTSGQ